VRQLLAGGGCGALGVAIERFAYRPLRDAPRIAPLITALGVSFFLENTVLLLFGAQTRIYNTPDFISFGIGIHVGPLSIDIVRLMVIVLSVVLMIALTLLVARTKLVRGSASGSSPGPPPAPRSAAGCRAAATR
jgi:branched-chain amino acid transport system permease protein